MKGKSLYQFFSICLATIFFIHLGGLKSWAVDPIVWEEECYPIITRSSTDPNIILPTIVSSVQDTIVVFFSQYSMDPNTTKASFHLYAGEDENNDLKENGNLELIGKILTYTYSTLERGIPYTVKIESTATDMAGNPLDGNFNGTGGEGTIDDWKMRFVIGGLSPGIGWSQIYDPNNIFKEDKVSCMIVDSQDRLWIGSEDVNICYFDGNTWQDKTPSVDLAQINDIPCMALDNEGCLWIGFNILENGYIIPKLAKLVNNSWEVIDLANVPSDEFIKDIAVDSEDNIWIISSVGILKYHHGQLDNYTPSGGNGPLSQFIQSLVIDPDDNLWIRTVDSKIWQPDIEGGCWGDEYTYESGYEINDMKVDSLGNIWLGTDNGLLKLDPSGPDPVWSEYTTAHGLPGDFINVLSVDTDNDLIWVGTSDGLGKFFITSEGAIAYIGNNASEISAEAVKNLTINARGEIWLGTDKGLQMRDEISPSVLENESFPSDGAIINKSENIRIVFSEPMDHEKTENSFIMIDNKSGQLIPGELFWLNSYTLVFDPDSLTSNRSYIVSIDTPAVDLTGNNLEANYSISFRTKPKSSPVVKPLYYGNYSFTNPYTYMDFQQNYQMTDYYSPINYQNQWQAFQQPSRDFNFQSGQGVDLSQTYYQKALPIGAGQSYVMPYTQLQPYYQVQYEAWNFSGTQEQLWRGFQLESWKQPTLPWEMQQESFVSQFNQQSYNMAGAYTQSPSYYQSYQTWDYKDYQQ